MSQTFTEKYHRALFKLRDDFDALHADAEASLPKTLYHYTNAAGFQGIVSSQRLWATYVPFLNDSQEHRYACALLEQLISQRLAQSTDVMLSSFYRQIEGSIATLTKGLYRHFVACLCTRNDLLSQWRGYGPSGGFSLGFDRASFSGELYNNNHERHFRLRKVIYDQKQQLMILDGFLQLYEDFVTSNIGNENDPESFVNSASVYFTSDVDLWLISFKNEAFSEENEWRLVVTDREWPGKEDFFSPLRFRTVGGMIVPYRELTLAVTSEDAPYLPLTEVMVGPSADPSLSREGVRMLLRSAGYGPDFSVLSSRIPLR